MKTVNIIGIIASVLLMVISVYYADEVGSARWRDWMDNDFSRGGRAADITFEAAGICLIFSLFYTLATIFNLAKIKTTTTKVMSIILISFTGIMLFFNLGVLADPGGLTFDESGGFFAFMSLMFLAFYIVFLVQIGVAKRKNKIVVSSPDILDDDII